MQELTTESVIDSRYRIVRKLGTGGMSVVYLCEDMKLQRKVAVKVLHSRYAQDQEFVERFQREARSAAALQHPNVVAIYDRGQFEDTYYIAMEYLEGRSLKEVITKEAPLPVERVLKLAQQILSALRYAHQNGIVHRDVKPQNVIVDDDDNAKVTDFGIARAAGSEITEVGSILGTAQYLSPEQAQGKQVSDASDIYSVGIVLYEMLTGCVPFDGESAVSIALKHVNEAPKPIRKLVASVPEAVEVVVMRTLEKDPTRRYQSVEVVARELDQAARTGKDKGQQTAAWAPVVLPSGDAKAASKSAKDGKSTEKKSDPDDSKSKPPEKEQADASKDKPKKLDRKKAIWLGLAVAVLAGIVIAGFFLFKSEKIEVPTLIGVEVEDARSTLEQSGLVVQVRRVNSNAPLGQVLEQDPIAGDKVSSGSTVKLTVSKGPGTTKVPELSGVTEQTAKKRLRKENLKVDVEKESSADVELGKVIRSDPRSGSSLSIGSRVLIVVSSGPSVVDVPSVTGLSQQEAVSVLKDADLSVVVERDDSSKDEGTVVEQTPSAGSSVNEDTTVTIIVSNGKGAEVPGVVDLSEASAEARLEKAGFEVSIKTKSVDRVDKDGVVLSQSPSKGSDRRKGDTVTITVGQFEVPEPEGVGG